MEFRNQDEDFGNNVQPTISFAAASTNASPSVRNSAFSKPSPFLPAPRPVPLEQVGSGSSRSVRAPEPQPNQPSVPPPSPLQVQSTQQPAASDVLYHECLRNHAAALGGHVLDGCGEFMPSVPPEDSLKCAACGCHRSFHRRQSPGTSTPVSNNARFPLLLPPPHPYPPPQKHFHGAGMFPTSPTRGGLVAFANTSGSGGTTTESSSEDQIGGASHFNHLYASAAPGSGSGSTRKRFRTKFTPEQKERMLEFAERVGWKIQKQDDTVVQQFCAEVGVRRQVLKVWLHNNKHTFRKHLQIPHGQQDAQPEQPPPPPQQQQH